MKLPDKERLKFWGSVLESLWICKGFDDDLKPVLFYWLKDWVSVRRISKLEKQRNFYTFSIELKNEIQDWLILIDVAIFQNYMIVNRTQCGIKEVKTYEYDVIKRRM